MIINLSMIMKSKNCYLWCLRCWLVNIELIPMLAFDFHIYACISTGISYFEGDLTSFIHSFILTLSLLNFKLLFRSFHFSHTLSLLHFPYHPIEFTKKKFRFTFNVQLFTIAIIQYSLLFFISQILSFVILSILT